MKNHIQLLIEFSSRFDKDRKIAPINVKIAFREVLDMLLEDKTSEILRNHSLDRFGKRYHGLWSIDVTMDWRAIYRKESNKIIFMMLRTHQQLYGK
jgi:addiction module RelE/StbE family toxin